MTPLKKFHIPNPIIVEVSGLLETVISKFQDSENKGAAELKGYYFNLE